MPSRCAAAFTESIGPSGVHRGSLPSIPQTPLKDFAFILGILLRSIVA